MKKVLSILVIASLVFTFVFSTAYADTGKNQSQTNSAISMYKTKIKELKEELKKSRKDEAKKAKILKEIAKEKKKNKDNSFNIIINGNEITTSTQPEIRDGKLLLPVRPVIKALGAELVWIPATKTIIITKGDIKITLNIGSNIAIVNNVKTTLEHKIVLKNGGTMIPIGVISKILKQKYNFDKDSKVIIVDDDDDDDNNVDDNYNTVGNIALNKSAAASTFMPNDGTTTFAASNAFDGKKNTRWSSAYSDPQWISVDLGARKYIGKVKLYWEAAYAKTYYVQISEDGSTWVNVFTTDAGDGAIDEITLPSLPARYVRVLGLQRATGYGYSLWEVEVLEGVAPTGTLTVAPAAISGAVNLTSEGTGDWVNWGYNTASAFNRKATVTQKINNYTKIGTVEPVLTTGNPLMYSWTDGTPVTAVTNSITVPYISGAGNGFQFVVPADTAAKTLQVYVSAMSAKGKLEVTLSDGSAVAYTAYVDAPSIVTSKMFTVNYKALTSGQALIVKYTVDNMYSSGSGGVSLQAAALK